MGERESIVIRALLPLLLAGLGLSAPPTAAQMVVPVATTTHVGEDVAVVSGYYDPGTLLALVVGTQVLVVGTDGDGRAAVTLPTDVWRAGGLEEDGVRFLAARPARWPVAPTAGLVIATGGPVTLGPGPLPGGLGPVGAYVPDCAINKATVSLEGPGGTIFNGRFYACPGIPLGTFELELGPTGEAEQIIDIPPGALFLDLELAVTPLVKTILVAADPCTEATVYPAAVK